MRRVRWPLKYLSGARLSGAAAVDCYSDLHFIFIDLPAVTAL
jgi:hypothetical protein